MGLHSRDLNHRLFIEVQTERSYQWQLQADYSQLLREHSTLSSRALRSSRRVQVGAVGPMQSAPSPPPRTLISSVCVCVFYPILFPPSMHRPPLPSLLCCALHCVLCPHLPPSPPSPSSLPPLCLAVPCQAVIKVHCLDPHVTLVQTKTFSWFGFPDDTTPSSRDFLPGLNSPAEVRGVGVGGAGVRGVGEEEGWCVCGGAGGGGDRTVDRGHTTVYCVLCTVLCHTSACATADLAHLHRLATAVTCALLCSAGAILGWRQQQ